MGEREIAQKTGEKKTASRVNGFVGAAEFAEMDMVQSNRHAPSRA
jgi:hypothetical protein